jgi:ABC-type cobalamin/Fe3+-siderophores transport system ATPase subunit
VPDHADPLPRMLHAGEFEPYLRYIRFPHFRNLRDDLHINFDYPVTALVGPNGTNKTAILRALQGCPDYYNVGQYWFETNLDPINPRERHRFIYGYVAPTVGETVEVIKTRIRRRSRRPRAGGASRKAHPVDPDYFEPSRPIVQDGMQLPPKLPSGVTSTADRTTTRWKAITKDVVYLDFRSQLSAFDKYFYQIPYNARVRTLTDKKRFIRRRSNHLASTIASGRARHRYYNRERVIRPPKTLTSEQVSAISSILGRAYESITLVEHRYFDFDGYSVLLQASQLHYSEAFAGSGEFAVVMLVYAVTEAEPGSLVLLDEPEVSLHPGGQRQLLAFIREQAKLRRHQFILSTHSPEMIRDLPNEAIKLFQADPGDGKIDLLAQSSDPSDAFFRLGAPSEVSYSIFVEDGLAAAIVRRAIRPLGEAAYHQVTVKNVPSGASAMHNLIPAFAALDQRCLMFLDGDQRQEIPEDSRSIPDTELDSLAKQLLRGTPKLLLHGGNDPGLEASRLQHLRTVIDWMSSHVAYLPGNDPESLLLALNGVVTEFTSATAKKEWEQRARKAMGREEYEPITSAEILVEQERALASASDDAPEFVEIRERVKTFIESGGR